MTGGMTNGASGPGAKPAARRPKLVLVACDNSQVGQLASSMLPIASLIAALIRGKIYICLKNLVTMCTAHAGQAATRCVEWALDTFNQKSECLHGL